MNQRERFEATWREDYRAAGLDESFELAKTESGDYCLTTTACEFRAFQRGEASGLELAAKVCDEWATQFEPSSMAPAIDHYSARLLQRLSKAIRAPLAREGA